MQQARAHAAKRQKESQPLTVEIYRQIEAERVKMARDCAAAFDVEKMPPERLAPLVELYAEAQMPELADRALARGLAADGLVPDARAGLLVQAIRAGLRQRPKPDFPKLEKYSDALDALPDAAIEQKIAGHTSLNNYYRGDDVDAGIIKHSTWLIERAKTLSAELRKKYGYAELTDEIKGQLNQALKEFGQQFSATKTAAA